MHISYNKKALRNEDCATLILRMAYGAMFQLLLERKPKLAANGTSRRSLPKGTAGGKRFVHSFFAFSLARARKDLANASGSNWFMRSSASVRWFSTR